MKRFLDFACSLTLLVLLLPLLLILALAVRLSSPGPIFYREERIGRFGRPFTILKFRSMYTPEYLRDVLRYRKCEHTEILWRQDMKHAGDPRTTPVGRYLRKLSLDELPQLLNILRGNMSLVGPRPVPEAELRRYGNNAFFYKLLTPGLTGLWQVSGRNDVAYDDRVRLDIEYCRNWSLWLDLKILLSTIPVVLHGKGAY